MRKIIFLVLAFIFLIGCAASHPPLSEKGDKACRTAINVCEKYLDGGLSQADVLPALDELLSVMRNVPAKSNSDKHLIAYITQLINIFEHSAVLDSEVKSIRSDMKGLLK
jgi:hypothetical protein